MIKKIILCLLISILYLYPSSSSFAMDDFDNKIISNNGSFSVPVKLGKHHDTLLISCIDCRLREEISRFMTSVGFENKYYEIALPGASLSISGDPHGPSNQTVKNIIKLINDDQLKGIIIIDHSDCAAYKKFEEKLPGEFDLLPSDFKKFRSHPTKFPELEESVHKTQLDKAEQILSRMSSMSGKKIYKAFYQFNPDDEEVNNEIPGSAIFIDYKQ